MPKKKRAPKKRCQYKSNMLLNTTASYVKVIDNCVSYEIEPPSGGGPYSDQGTYGQDHTITGITLVGPDGCYDIAVPFEVKENKTYYLVYAIYSTGDSFSHTEGKIAFIDLYKSRYVAEENAKKCRSVTNESKSSSIILSLDDGRTYTYGCPWYGYFETLSSLVVQPVCSREPISYF